jgi:hypothetical protein
MKKYKTLLVLTITTLVVLLACKKEKPELNPAADPCACASEVTADFDILERNNLDVNFFTKTDHILSNRRAYFKAKEDDAEYTWYLGLDIEETQETFRFFDNTWIGSTIPITLVVKKEPNKVCFPDDDGYDSVVKYMNVYDVCHPHILDGDFIVAEKNSTDSIIIGLHQNEYPPEPHCFTFDFVNYDGNGSVCSGYYNGVRKNFRAIKSGSDNPFDDCNNAVINLAEINLKNEFVIKFQYREQSGEPLISKEYFGRKLL